MNLTGFNSYEAIAVTDDVITCKRISETEVECNGEEYTSLSRYPPGSKEFWICLGVYIGLVLLAGEWRAVYYTPTPTIAEIWTMNNVQVGVFAGIFSGLTLGLLSLDETTLQVVERAGTEKEKKHARRIMPLVRRHHLLLVTLLLANAASVEAMPLFMDKISSEVIAIVVSVTAVLLFGE